MRRGAVVWLAAAALVTVAACERPSTPAMRDGAAPEPSSDDLPPAGPGAPRVSERQGDRHARAAARRPRTVEHVEGTVSRAGERRIVIGRSGAAAMTLRVAAETTVTMDGRPARAEALPEGAEVRASYRTGGGGLPAAIAVEARTPAAQRPREPPRDPARDGG